MDTIILLHGIYKLMSPTTKNTFKYFIYDVVEVYQLYSLTFYE